MMQILHRPSEAWRQLGGLSTAEEISQQPTVWRELAQASVAQQASVAAFLGDWLSNPTNRVLLTGAGSSAYIGEIVADEINAAWPAEVRAVASTSLLSHPRHYLDAERPTLLVSFARSGNSPESTATVDLVRSYVTSSCFINITCNSQGALAAQGVDQSDTLNLLMPEASCDKGFAMTSSFTSMLLAALVVFGGRTSNSNILRIEKLAAKAEQLQEAWAPRLMNLARGPWERVVYLGSGPLEALAKEASLKVLELTAGRVLAMANTSLGFRHGPKSALNSRTLVVCFLSCDGHAAKYDQSLLDELRKDQVAGNIAEFGPSGLGNEFADETWSDPWLAPLWLNAAQLIALQMSAELGLTPDNPFPDGTVNRVVQGVTIYPYGTR